MTAPMTPAGTAGLQPSSSPVSTVHEIELPVDTAPVVLDDATALLRMLDDDRDITQLIEALKARHRLDGGGPLFESFTRASGMAELLAIEIRHMRNLLGGTK